MHDIATKIYLLRSWEGQRKWRETKWFTYNGENFNLQNLIFLETQKWEAKTDSVILNNQTSYFFISVANLNFN